MNIGRAIKLCRTQRNLTQADLALSAGISTSYLSLLERGQRDANFSTLESVATALKIPVSIIVFLATGTEELEHLNSDLVEKLSHLSLKLIEASNHEEGVLSRTIN